jgi:hypothetical protein
MSNTKSSVGSFRGGATGFLGELPLPNTTVTPGTYTDASITVSQQGTITAISNGTALSKTAEGDIPLADFLTMPTLGFELLPRPGPGKWIYVDSVALSFRYGGIPFANGEQINVRYYGGSGIMLNLMSAATVTGISDNEAYWLANTSGGNVFFNMEDLPVSIMGNTGITNFTGGTGTTIKYHVTYTIYNL